MIETSTITTYTCSIPYCRTEPRIVGGPDPHPIMDEEGWELATAVLGSTVDLCPEHVCELREWLVGWDGEK